MTPYPLVRKQNHWMLTILKLIPRPLISYHILSRLVTPYHTLSPRLELKPFDVDNFKISSHYYVFITFCFRYRQ